MNTLLTAIQNNYARTGFFVFSFFLILILWCSPTFASTITSESQIDWFTMGMTLFGGLAIFLFGMEQMATALKEVAGDSMKQILAKLTNSRIMGLITGAFVTAVIQSSSVTTVMLIGFVTAGLMSLSQAIGVILGADIGTTITAQIVAFKVTKYALILVAIGFGMLFMGKNDGIKQYGSLTMGLGMIFFGMGIMSEGMYPLRTYEPFIGLMQNVSNPLVGILVATLFTSLVQSSSATMGVVIALSLQGLISLEAGIALALGANIGTCATAGLAAIGKPREAVRVAVAHVMFKIIGVLIIVWFIPQLADFVRAISPAADAGLTGIDKLASETPRQIANAHTIFNIGIGILFLPLATPFARLCEWLVPDKTVEEILEEQEEQEKAGIIIEPKYLDISLFSTPVLALEMARKEIAHMGGYVQKMLQGSIPAVLEKNADAVKQQVETDDIVDILHANIVRYLGALSKNKLSDAQSNELVRLLEAVNDLENIGDIIETDVADIMSSVERDGIIISEKTQGVISRLNDMVVGSLETALSAVEMNDVNKAANVIQAKNLINKKIYDAEHHQAARLVADAPNRVETYALEVELIERLKRIYYFSKRIAKTILPTDLETIKS
ncbi:MAG: Na/Pi cotransporter family protein [Gammaproteobacteria bacterium]|nr:Na/Pi cotransporter family protein [Gammaproteobacteria bacterium]